MKQLGYVFLFLTMVIILIPLIIVRGCSHNAAPTKDKKEVENIHSLKVYIASEDKVVEMNMNEYLKGVVAAEMPASFHIEALKAQAVAARTYTYHKIKGVQRTGVPLPEHKGADVCSNPGHCKAWMPKDKAMDKWGIISAKDYWNKISSAVDDTANIIVTYESEPIDAVFHSTSSGKTENSEDVWSSSIPYLRSVESAGDDLSPKFTSKVEITMEEFKNKLKKVRPEIKLTNDQNLDIENTQHSQGGGIKTIRIGGCDFKGNEIRSIFALNSANFTVEVQEGKVVFIIKGNGHGVGMSQYGANYLAQQGKSFEEILKHYYSNVNIDSVSP